MSLPSLNVILSPSLGGVLAIPFLFVPLVYLLRRWRVGGFLALVVSLALAYLIWLVPPQELRYIFTWPIQFDGVVAYTFTLLCLLLACLFFLSLNVSQGWSFYPFGLLMLSLLGLAMVNQHLGLRALVMEIAVLVSVFIIQGGRTGSTRAALRFLIMMTLAVPLFLLAAWQLDQVGDSRDNVPLLMQISLLVGCGFGLWLGVAPLHGWLNSIAAEAKPGIAAFVLITFPTVAITMLLQLLNQVPWLNNTPQITDVVLQAGLFTALVGGLFAAVQRAFGSLMGYAALFDMGVGLIAVGVGMGSEQGRTVVLFSLLVRMISLALIAASMSAIEAGTDGDAFQQLRGLAKKFPIPAMGLMVGGLTLAGTPFTAGFVARWMLLQSLSSLPIWWPLAILLAGLGLAIGYIRGGRSLVEPVTHQTKTGQSRGLNLLIMSLISLCLGLGLFPQAVLQWIANL